MHDIRQKATELSERLNKLKEALGLPEKKKKVEILETEAASPNLWDDADKAKKVMQELSDIKKSLEEVEELTVTISTLKELSDTGELTADFEREVAKAAKQIEKFELISFLSGEYDSKNAVLGIYSGQGGTEAMDWANMLYRMYLRFCERRGFRTEMLDMAEGEEAGLKRITFKVEGLYAYGYLKGEAGTHRLVRQSPFNADKLRQTSFAL